MALLFGLFPFLAQAKDPIAEVINVQGIAEVKTTPEASWQAAKLRQLLDSGAQARVGPDSRMALLLFDQTQLRLKENTQVRLERTGDGKKAVTMIRLDAGKTWVQSKAIPDHLIMQTPAAVAAIRGTDWEMEVAPDGRAVLTVLHGKIDFYNDQGHVTVQRDERAVAEKGKAPVKFSLRSSSQRVQWVTAFSVTASRYPALLQALDSAQDSASLAMKRGIAALDQGELAIARGIFVDQVQKEDFSTPLPWLLMADYGLYDGDLDAAELTLRAAAKRFPGHPDIIGVQVRVALLRDDPEMAQTLLRPALALHPKHAVLQRAAAEIARFKGDAAGASAAYQAIIAAAPQDAQGWQGLGSVEAEKENLSSARRLLSQALSLAPEAEGLRGELGILETFANRFGTAQEHFDVAIAAQGADYVALTGLGLLQLKTGETETALRTLLKASLLEPHYARAVIYSAVAYYQLGRPGVALEMLQRAMELDRLDPLPHQLSSLIHSDALDYHQAIDSAREALRLMPYLRSLNQLANNQKGAANLGSALAQFGLEDWARNYAQESYNPFWGGSHLFLADRYSGNYLKQSELLQGYMTDPTAFGASNRFQTLLQRPGYYGGASLLASHGKAVSAQQPTVNLNGFANASMPVAYFAELLGNRVSPGNQAFDGNGTTLTAAIGAIPHENLGTFIFANRFSTSLSLVPVSGMQHAIDGLEERLELGFNYRFAPDAQSWLKYGRGNESVASMRQDRRNDAKTDTRFNLQPQRQDLQWRHSARLGQHTLSVGMEVAEVETRERMHSVSAFIPGVSFATEVHSATSGLDRSASFYLFDDFQINDRWRIDGGLAVHRHQQSRDMRTDVMQSGFVFPAESVSENHTRHAMLPRLGLSFRPETGTVWRLAYQDWIRPVVSNTLGPVATAGLPLDDQGVLPGGEFQRMRLQWDREVSALSFLSGFIDAKRTKNLGQPGNVQNQNTEVADLDRLKNRANLVFHMQGEALEETPVFLQGDILSAGATLNQRLSPTTSLFSSYVHTQTRNTHPWFADNQLPYHPRHHAALGASWIAPHGWILQGVGHYRSMRFADEMNQIVLHSGWDVTAKASWQSSDKRYVLEAYATGLFKPDNNVTAGIYLILRY